MDGLRRGGIIGGIRYAVGKVIGGRLYVHRDYAERELGEIYLSAAAAFRGAHPGWDYRTVSYHPKSGRVCFQEVPGFDREDEPTVGRMVNLGPDGLVERYEAQIYHHKWMWVDDLYPGFDVPRSVERSRWCRGLGLKNPSGHRRIFEEQLRGLGART